MDDRIVRRPQVLQFAGFACKLDELPERLALALERARDDPSDKGLLAAHGAPAFRRPHFQDACQQFSELGYEIGFGLLGAPGGVARLPFRKASIALLLGWRPDTGLGWALRVVWAHCDFTHAKNLTVRVHPEVLARTRARLNHDN